MGEKNVVIVVDGSVDDSKRFVKVVKDLGYRSRKINPKRLPKEVGRLYFPNEHPNTDFAYTNIQKFLESQDAYWYYVVKEIGQLRDVPSVSILVNSQEFSEKIKDIYGGFHIEISSGEEWVSGYDNHINSDGDFDKSVEDFIRIVTDDIKNIKYKEIE